MKMKRAGRIETLEHVTSCPVLAMWENFVAEIRNHHCKQSGCSNLVFLVDNMYMLHMYIPRHLDITSTSPQSNRPFKGY